MEAVLVPAAVKILLREDCRGETRPLAWQLASTKNLKRLCGPSDNMTMVSMATALAARARPGPLRPPAPKEER